MNPNDRFQQLTDSLEFSPEWLAQADRLLDAAPRQVTLKRRRLLIAECCFLAAVIALGRIFKR